MTVELCCEFCCGLLALQPGTSVGWPLFQDTFSMNVDSWHLPIIQDFVIAAIIERILAEFSNSIQSGFLTTLFMGYIQRIQARHRPLFDWGECQIRLESRFKDAGIRIDLTEIIQAQAGLAKRMQAVNPGTHRSQVLGQSSRNRFKGMCQSGKFLENEW
jgi:hypothetical protein